MKVAERGQTESTRFSEPRPREAGHRVQSAERRVEFVNPNGLLWAFHDVAVAFYDATVGGTGRDRKRKERRRRCRETRSKERRDKASDGGMVEKGKR